ncbi:MAG: TIGR02584 family CRISPR-associated protein, partial [Magnetococcales bacterium]|nr:TIGR02584 family CRISPR-associated protein [Magnetococcales bacterium]
MIIFSAQSFGHVAATFFFCTAAWGYDNILAGNELKFASYRLSVMNHEHDVHVCHLVVLVGLTPQVITEALYMLMVRERCEVARISVLTSPEGAEAVRNALLFGQEPPLERFCREYGFNRNWIGFGSEDIHSIWSRRMAESESEMTAMDGLFERLAHWCGDGEIPVVACVAGGRKDMAVLFAQVFGLLARPTDRLVHLFASPEFENLAEFFYPPPKPATLAVHRSGHGVVFLNTAEAHVEMVQIPLVRLRTLLDEETRRGAISLETARNRVQREVESLNPNLRIDTPKRMVCYHGGETILPPKDFAVLLFFARCRRDGHGPGGDGWIPGRELDQPDYIEQLEVAYRETTGGQSQFRDHGWVP